MFRTPTAAAMVACASRGWTLVSADGATDVEVTAADDATLGDVLPRLGRGPGVELWAGSTRLRNATPLTAPELAHGAVLGVGGPAPRPATGSRSSALELHVVGGPDAGRTLPLGQGRHVLGRGSEATIRLDDPDVSRRHVAVHVGGGQITVADLASTNGSRLDGHDLDEQPVSWPAGAVLRLGGSAVRIAGPGGAAAALQPGPGGRLRLRPSRQRTPPTPQIEIPFPRPPEPPHRRRPAWGAVALPAVGGLVLAWLLHSPALLLLAALSPVVALGTWLRDRRSRRRTGRQDAAAHALELLGARSRLADAVRAGVRHTEAASPDLATLAGAARRRSPPLWSRSRGDPAALTVRLGSGPAHVGVTRIDPDGSRHAEIAPHVPAAVDLRTCGGLAVVGPRERVVGVLRGVLTQLTALHAPGEVDVVLLPDADHLADWAWARWLPHLDPAVPQGDERALHTWLTGVVARRRAGWHTGTRPGWLVVVVDRQRDPLLATALRDARDVGVVTLTGAESRDDLPVSADAVLRLRGTGVLGRPAAPDLASVVVDRLPHPVAAQFARDLAALVPATAVSPGSR